MTPSGIEPATFRFEAQYINLSATTVKLNSEICISKGDTMYCDKSKWDFPISQQRLRSGGSPQNQLINPTPYITTPRVCYSFITDYIELLK
jgi:hypothetical protein